MAIQPVLVQTSPSGASANSLKLFTWGLMANGDSGQPVQFADWADRCMQVSGTYGAGGSVSWQGSNDGTNWAVLNDINGNALTATTGVLRQMNEAPLWIRPIVTAGDGTTQILATVLARRVVQTKV